MHFGLVGVGGAGGRLASAIRRRERSSDGVFTEGHVLVFDTDRKDLAALDGIPPERRVPIGDTIDHVEGGGVSGDPELGAEVARTDDYEIQRSFDDLPIEDLDGMLVVAGIGGGTGGGTGAVMVEMCQALFDLPVYALVVLPHVEEGGRVAHTAARALQSFVRLADNVLVFDNEEWIEEQEHSYAEANHIYAERIVDVLSLGDFDGSPAEARVDRTDIIRTLSTGGVTSIGRATWAPDLGWRRWFQWAPGVGMPPRNGTDDARRLKELVQESVESLSLPCGIESTERALVVTAGPPDMLSRKGFESARYWLEQELDTVEIVAGDEPRPKRRAVTALVVLSNVTAVPRIEDLKTRGLAAGPPSDS